MRSDLRLALLLTRGSDRREWLRVVLTGLGAALATGCGLAAAAVASIRGQVALPYAHGLLNQPGQRSGVVMTLLLLLVPVLGFVAQCARIGAVHRDRRLAGLRLAGATPWQVRRLAAAEAGLACLVGSAVGATFCALLLPELGHRPPAWAWVGFAAVALAVPVLGAVVSALALRRVVASPLGWVRRVRPSYGRAPALALLVPVLVVFCAAALIVVQATSGAVTFPLGVLAAVLLTGAGAVAVTGATARVTGRILAEQAESPAVLVAAGRLQSDPWFAARTHAAVLLVAVVGVGFVGVREMLLDDLNNARYLTAEDMAFYTTGIDLAGTAVLVALVLSLCGLTVGTAESLATRRRGLAAQAAAGVPSAVLGRALLLETALPLAPAMVLACIGGTGVYIAYGLLVDAGRIPLLLPLLVPVAVYAAALLAAATSLPLLRRSVHPAELRFT